MSILQLFIIAALQGVTEWLPISSSAHVLLAADWFGVTGRDERLINAASNLGTLIAMLLYFWKDVGRATAGGFELLGAPFRQTELSSGGHLALMIIIATPIALAIAVGYELLLPEATQDALRTPYIVAGTTILFGLLLWWGDVKGGTDRTEPDMTAKHALLIGATQAIAVILPGTSRSGITMTAARALGYARTEAARFSMLIGAPLLAAVSAYGLLGLATGQADGSSMLTLEDGLIVAFFAFVTGILSIWALMAILRRMSFLPFVIYRLILGLALLAVSPFGAQLLGI